MQILALQFYSWTVRVRDAKVLEKIMLNISKIASKYKWEIWENNGKLHIFLPSPLHYGLIMEIIHNQWGRE